MRSLSNQLPADWNLPFLVVWILTIFLLGCNSSSTAEKGATEYDGYIDITIKLLEESLDSSSWEYAEHWFDSAGLPTWQPMDSNVTVISGMTCIGTFSCYPMMMVGELFEGDILGDSAKERLLLVQDHLTLTMYGGFHFYFYAPNASSHQPNARFEFYCEDLKGIVFRPISGSKSCNLVLQFEQTPSTYMNEGIEIIQFESDTAYQIFSQLTAFYDWKDYGKSDFSEEYGQEKLSEDQGYRETSEVIFSDENEDGVLEIDVNTIEEIVTDTMPMDIRQLKAIRRLSSSACRFEYDLKARKYRSQNPDCN